MTRAKHCYYCNTELVAKKDATPEQLASNRFVSEEHILPDFLGGKLSSWDLLCNSCNNDLGTRLDGALSKELILSRILTIKRDRGKQTTRGITGKDKSGIEFAINKDRQSILVRPQVFLDENGGVDFVVAKDLKEGRRCFTYHSRS